MSLELNEKQDFFIKQFCNDSEDAEKFLMKIVDLSHDEGYEAGYDKGYDDGFSYGDLVEY